MVKNIKVIGGMLMRKILKITKATKKYGKLTFVSVGIIGVLVGCGSTDTKPEVVIQSVEQGQTAKSSMQLVLKDSQGNPITLDGIGTTDSNGKINFVGIDSKGNPVEFNGDIDSNGNISNRTFVTSNTIVADNGSEVTVTQTQADIKVSQVENTPIGGECDTFTQSQSKTVTMQNQTEKQTQGQTSSSGSGSSQAQTSSGSNQSQTSSSGSGSSQQPQTQAQTERQTSAGNTSPSHTHDFVAHTETIHHDEQGHYETQQVRVPGALEEVKVGTRTVVDVEGWDEPVMKYVTHCFKCDGYFDTAEEHDAHIHEQVAQYRAGLISIQDMCNSCENIDIPTGEYIHHDAITHEEDVIEYRPVYKEEQVWVVDKAAYDEEITTYSCSCGATR